MNSLSSDFIQQIAPTSSPATSTSMDPSHLLPKATPQHHTEFGQHDLVHAENRDLSSLKPQDFSSPPRLNTQASPRSRTQYQRATTEDAPVQSSVIPNLRPSRRKTIVLCFDGTGNEFHGDSSDSNILKIFRMLDRSSGLGFHYYQPGIGTYVTTASLSSTGTLEKLKDWYTKAKDSAVGTSFDQHVVGGYKFLMQYYSPGDNIFMFGFSRGSYTARFLAEMIDWIGLITHGNDEMIQFAWRTFSEWKQLDNSMQPEALKKRKKSYEFMVSFRETFSRPVRRIRYLGLFDTVNSVPRFENAMMRGRLSMPYSAKSSAKVIRHAVSIDERRAKFRSDLISTEGRHKKQTDAAKAKHLREKAERHQHHHEWFHEPSRFRHTSTTKTGNGLGAPSTNGVAQAGNKEPNLEERLRDERHRFRPHSRSRSRSTNGGRPSSPDANSYIDPELLDDSDDDSSDGDEDDQDIDELWFPGGHADIGGGWELEDGEVPLSHVPLVWIVREAKKSGLQLDEDKMRALGCWDDSEDSTHSTAIGVPSIEVSGSPTAAPNTIGDRAGNLTFKDRIHQGSTKGKLHDCLAFRQGLPFAGVLSWNIMEYIPFRRMDLREDGSWKPIRWPLPRGEVRDMPDGAKVHYSALKRMAANSDYRPGNLILGGGGVGMRKAPEHAGTGEWKLVAEEGNVVGECFVRVKKAGVGEKNGIKNKAGRGIGRGNDLQDVVINSGTAESEKQEK